MHDSTIWSRREIPSTHIEGATKAFQTTTRPGRIYACLDDDFDDRDLATAPEESNHADSSYLSLSADTNRDIDNNNNNNNLFL